MSSPSSKLPHQLCLTFRAPYEIKIKTENFRYSGYFPDEIANEFSAFLSLLTRRRIFAIEQMRENGYPIEQSANSYKSLHSQAEQFSKEIAPNEIYLLLDNLLSMNGSVAERYVLSMRLYHSAIELMYSEPEFSYIFLVMCLEAISSSIFKEYQPNAEDKEKFLNSNYPKWKELSDFTSNKNKLIDVLLCNENFTFKKFYLFVSTYVPEKFWHEEIDDAKPNYLNKMVPPKLKSYEKITEFHLKNVLRNIYDARSRFIHSGYRFPSSIIYGLYRLYPGDVLFHILDSPLKANKRKKRLIKIPPLLTFERLVSYTLVEFLQRQIKK